MHFNNNISSPFLTKRHRTVTWGTILLGAALFLLALLIFAYPALIAYFIAAVILFAGFSALAIGWKLWRLGNKITKFEKIDYDPFFYRTPETHRSYFTYIRW